MNPMRPAEELSDPRGPDIGPGTVLAVHGRQAVVRLEDGGESVSATLSVGADPLPGDRLLVARGASGAWVLAVLGAIRPAPLVADDGAEARLEGGALTVRDPAGRLLFEHRPDEGVSVVHAPYGDLRLSAPRGSVSIDAKRDVTLRAGRTASVGRSDDEALTFERRGARLKARVLEASVSVARLALIDTTFAASRVTAAVETARHRVGLLETTAKRVVTKAKTSFTDVEGLAQTRVGRLRQIAEGSAQILGKTMLVKADEDVAIKGEKIHLA